MAARPLRPRARRLARFPERLYALGCSLEVTGAGLIARMDLDHTRVDAFTLEPESATVLTSIFAELVAHADELGGAG